MWKVSETRTSRVTRPPARKQEEGFETVEGQGSRLNQPNEVAVTEMGSRKRQRRWQGYQPARCHRKLPGRAWILQKTSDQAFRHPRLEVVIMASPSLGAVSMGAGLTIKKKRT